MIDLSWSSFRVLIIMILETFLILAALPFVGLTLFFGSKNGYYDSDDYTGDGCAHDVKR